MSARTTLALLGLLAAGCADDGVIRRVSFSARAGGFERAATGPVTVHTAAGWDLTITAAQLSVGSMYFRNAPPDDGPVPYDGRAVAEVLGPFVVDALDGRTQEITGGGNGTTEAAMVGELRFGPASAGMIAAGGRYAIAYVAGTAVRDTVTVNFAGAVSLGNDPARSDYQGVSDRRLSRLAAQFTVRDGGVLTVRVDPTHWFDQLDFSGLGPAGAPMRELSSSTSALQFRNGVASASGAFQFDWQDAP